MRKQLQPTPVNKVEGRRCFAGFGNKVGELAASADSGKKVGEVDCVSLSLEKRWVSC